MLVRASPALCALALSLGAGCRWSPRPAGRDASVANSATVSTSASGRTGDGTATSSLLPRQAVVPVHITYVLQALRPSLDSLFPTRDSLTRAECAAGAGLVCHQYVYAREPLAIQSAGSRLTLTTKLAFRAQVGAPGISRLLSCGYAPETMRRTTLSMATTLYWRKDWRLGAQATTLSADFIDQCRVSALGVDATSAMRSVVNRQLATFAASADTSIPNAANFRPLADSLWKSFLEPSALDSLGTLWLLMEPDAIRVAALTGDGPSFRTAIVLYARPRIVSGRRPIVRPRPLPPLVLGDAPRGFDVPVTVELPFAEVERRARELLVAETATGSVRVDSVHLRAVGDSVHVDLDVQGALRGRLSLDARLQWDATARELVLDGLDWSLASRGMLSRVKATLAAPLIARAIRRASLGGRIPLGAQLDLIKAEMMTKLNGTVAPGVVLGSSVTDLRITGVTSTADAFIVLAQLRGQAGVWIR
ncbi:MAG TPA: DUF4403 family protein [Gemmatimonas sp.]|nr:DUF4403 family protein [Gemmatimonas sp.]